MFEKVLFATDFSAYARKITDCIGDIPGIKEIVLLHVIDTKKIAHGEESESVLARKAELMLEEQKNFLELPGIEVKPVVKTGIPSREILRSSEEEKVSLVVIGARGRSLIKDILLGSVSSDVLRYGKTNLLIMRHRVAEKLEGDVFEKYCERIFSKVLFPTDFSQGAEQALSVLKQVQDTGEFILMHAVDKGETKDEVDANVEKAEISLKEMHDRLIADGIPAKFHLHIGDPSLEINRIEEEEDVSVIAIGSRGKGLIEEIMVGSTAVSVVRNAKRPVLVLRI